MLGAAVVLIAAVVLFFHWWGGGAARFVEATAKQNDIRVRRNVPVSPEAPALRVDLFVPTTGENLPIAAVLPGGGWNMGHKGLKAVQFLAGWLAERGVIGVAMDYRLIPAVSPTEQTRDVARGVAWLALHATEFRGDPHRIFLVGHSAGAHLAALVACDRRYLDKQGTSADVPAGIVAISNVFDLRNTEHPLGSIAKRKITTVFRDAATRELLSPLLYVQPGAPPFLILHGMGDHLIALDQGAAMVEALHAAGTQAEFHDLPGRDHIGLFHNMDEPGDAAAEMTLAYIRDH